MKPSDLYTALVHSINKNLPILIVGSPGLGKTKIVEQACEATDSDLIISHPVVSDPTDYKGLPFVVNDEAQFLPFGELKKLIEAKKRTVFFLDDFGQAPVSVQAAAMQLLLAREINGQKISDHVVFVAATNGREDKAGVTGILEPVKSRFAAIVRIGADLEDWTRWAYKHKISSEIISYLQFKPNQLHDFKANNDLKNSPSPRTWEFASKIIKAEYPGEIEFEMLCGSVGEGAATELKAFLSIYRELPKFEDIMKDPEKHKLYKDKPDVSYAVVGMLVEHVDEKNVEKIMKYITRIQIEFQTLFMSLMKSKNRALLDTPVADAWVTKNAGIFVGS